MTHLIKAMRGASGVETCETRPSNLKLLMHFDGSDASTTFTDEISHSLTAFGNAQLDTAQYKFGTASYLGDGTGDYVQTDSTSSDFSFGTGDFTIAMWVRFNTLGTNASLALTRVGSGGNYWYLGKGNTNKFNFASGNTSFIETTSTYSADTWYHLAITRSGTSLKLWVDGSEAGSATNSTDFSSVQKLNIGGNDSEGSVSLDGWIDELIICKGTAVWTSTFTPPTLAYC